MIFWFQPTDLIRTSGSILSKLEGQTGVMTKSGLIIIMGGVRCKVQHVLPSLCCNTRKVTISDTTSPRRQEFYEYCSFLIIHLKDKFCETWLQYSVKTFLSNFHWKSRQEKNLVNCSLFLRDFDWWGGSPSAAVSSVMADNTNFPLGSAPSLQN